MVGGYVLISIFETGKELICFVILNFEFFDNLDINLIFNLKNGISKGL